MNPVIDFTGVVEAIDDKENINRVKVRIHGVHSDKTELDAKEGKGISTDDLPWAYVAMPTTGAGMHGFGQSPHGLVEGSWVWGVSRDGDQYNELIVLAVLLGKQTQSNPNPSSPLKAFFGRDGKWPDDEFLGESDVSRHARGQNSYTDEKWKPVPEIKRDERLTGIQTVHGAWDEKETPANPKYPYNKILFDGPSRSLFEIDETEGSERIAEFHGPSHTYREIHPDGSIQTRIVGDAFEIVQKDNNLFVQGEINITVVGNANILSEQGEVNIEAPVGDINVKSNSGKITLDSNSGGIDLKSNSGDINLDSSSGDIGITSGSGNVAIRANSGNFQVNARDGINLTSIMGRTNINSPIGGIALNSGASDIVLRGSKLRIQTGSVSGL